MSGKTGVMGDSVGDKSSEAADLTADEIALQLKKKARRRLVGAIALALFAVITLPMVMDHRPRPSAPEIQVRIPSQEGPGFTGRIAPGTTVKPTPLPPVAPSTKVEPAVTVPEPAVKSTAPSVADARKAPDALSPQVIQKDRKSVV